MATAGVSPGSPVGPGYTSLPQNDHVVIPPNQQGVPDSGSPNNPMASAPPAYDVVTTTDQYPPPPTVPPTAPTDNTEGVSI